MRLPFLIAAALAATLATPALAQERGQPDKLVYIEGGDPAMKAAVAKARSELADFFAHALAPAPSEQAFSIKYNLTPDAKPEFIWATVVSHRAGITTARLANNPVDPRFRLGQQVEVRDADIIDWGYYRGRIMQGHYSTRVLLGHMAPDEAAQIRQALGW